MQLRLISRTLVIIISAAVLIGCSSKPLEITREISLAKTVEIQPVQPESSEEIEVELGTEPAQPESQGGFAVIDGQNAKDLALIKQLDGHTDRVLSLAPAQGGTLISGGSDNNVFIWDPLNSDYPEMLTAMGNGVCDLAVSINNILLAYDYAHSAFLWDLSAKELTADQDFAEDGCSGVFSSDGSIFVTEGRGDSIIFWDTDSLTKIKTFSEPNGGGFAYGFSPDRQLFASSGHNGSAAIWDYESGEILRTLKYLNGDMHDMAFSPDGKFLASGSTDSVVLVWEVETGALVHTLRHSDGLFAVNYSPDGRLLASASADRTVRIWDAETGEKLKTLLHADEVNDVVFSTDGSLIFSGGYDNLIYVWGAAD